MKWWKQREKKPKNRADNFLFRFIKLIVKGRYLIFGVLAAAFIGFALCIPKVTINYDDSIYLPKKSVTRRGLDVNNREFGDHGELNILIKNVYIREEVEATPAEREKDRAVAVSIDEALLIKRRLSEHPAVMLVNFNPLDQNSYSPDKHALMTLVLKYSNYAAETRQMIDELKTLLDNAETFLTYGKSIEYYMTGQAFISYSYNKIIYEELMLALAIIIPLILIILFLTTSSWIEPLLFLIVVGVAVTINMGTNIMFSSVSYLTHATSGLLQLALCMDYTITILHRYRQLRDEGEDKEAAIIKGTKQSILPVVGSSLTTISGFIALLFMQYRIGFDIGLVLIKGAVLSTLISFLLMPGLIYVFDKLLEKTKHRRFLKTAKGLKTYYKKTRFIAPALLALAIIAGGIIQTKINFTYSEAAMVSNSKILKRNQKEMKAAFGYNNPYLFVVKDGTAEAEFALAKQLTDGVQISNTEIIKAKTVLGPHVLTKEIDDFLANPLTYAELLQAAYYSDIPLEEMAGPLLKCLYYMIWAERGTAATWQEEKIALTEINDLLARLEKSEVAKMMQMLEDAGTAIDKDKEYPRITMKVILSTGLTDVKPETKAFVLAFVDAFYKSNNIAKTSINNMFKLFGDALQQFEMLAKLTGSLAPNYELTPLFNFLKAQMLNNFKSRGGYSRIIAIVDLEMEAEKTFLYTAKVQEIYDTLYKDAPEHFLLGASPAVSELKEIISKDMIIVNILTVVFIMVVILLSFKSLLLPFILLFIIQGASWINMSIPVILREPLLFLGYVVVTSIMLGSTVDYGILYASRYLENRKNKPKYEALEAAADQTIATITTSGLILMATGILMQFTSSMPATSLFGGLVGRGAGIAMIFIIFGLPQCLVILDKPLIKLTYKLTPFSGAENPLAESQGSEQASEETGD